MEKKPYKEQETLDNNDDQVSELNVHIQRLITLASKDQGTTRVATKQLTLLQANLESIDTAVCDIEDGDEDVVCIEAYRDQVVKVKTELASLKATLLVSDAAPDDPIMQGHTHMKRTTFGCLLHIKKHLHTIVTSMPKSSEITATKLPTLEFPSFHGDILKWKNFREQFCILVHHQTKIPQEEYLQSVIKDKTARNLIAGLTRSSDHYEEAVRALQERYNHPCQIHQVHVHCIIEAPPLRDGIGKEMHALHDLIIQHLRALKLLGH